MNTPQTAQKRPRGRPKLENALTPAERSKRYRERLRQRMSMSSAALLAHLFEEIAKPYDPVREQQWRDELQAMCDQIDGEFRDVWENIPDCDNWLEI